MSKTTSQDIKATLWKAAGTFRGTIDAANYKDFVLSMLFLKYLDDTYKEFLRDLEERYTAYPDPAGHPGIDSHTRYSPKSVPDSSLAPASSPVRSVWPLRGFGGLIG